MQGGASPIPLIPCKISSSSQKKTNRIHAQSRKRRRKRRRQRMVTTIEQSLNKPCSKPSNIRVVLWNETHRFEKPTPRRLGDYKSPRAQQGVQIACMGRQLRYLGVPKKRTAKGVFYFVKRKQAETVWTRRTAFLKHECSWIIHELNMNWFFEHETRECSEINETFNETINGHSWRNISCLERTLFETWEKRGRNAPKKTTILSVFRAIRH